VKAGCSLAETLEEGYGSKDLSVQFIIVIIFIDSADRVISE
jgi:hypothetical protein